MSYDTTGRPCRRCRRPLLSDRDGMMAKKCAACRSAAEAGYRERRRAAAILPSVRAAVIARDGMQCRHCGVAVVERVDKDDFPPNGIELDHLVPAVHGGLGVLENLVVSCHRCNSSRGARPLQAAS